MESTRDWDSDEMDWDPKMKKIYYDDSWAKKEHKVDDSKDWDIQKSILRSGYMSFPSTLLEMFQDKAADLKREVQEKAEEKSPSSSHNRHGRKSMMTVKEMERFLKLERLFKRMQSISDCKPNQYNDYKEYKALQSKVLQEQEDYQKYLFQLATKSIDHYNHVDPEAAKWVRRCMDASLKEIQKYERYYVHLKEFGISVIPFKNDALPTAIQNLTVTLGFQKQLASLKFPMTIPKTINQKPRRDKTDESYCWEKCVVSTDVNAMKLAIAWNADIVISLGALQTLADNHSPFLNEWELPIVVRSYEGIEFDRNRKVAFVDKALPPKKITPRESNWRYFKEVVKFLCDVPYVWGLIPSKNDSQLSKERQSSSASDVSENYSSQDDDLIMQVDGANDEKTTPTKKKQTKILGRKSSLGKNKAQSKNDHQTQSFMEIKNLWTKEHDFDAGVGQSLIIDEENSGGFQPFIGRKSLSSLLKKPKPSELKVDNDAEGSRKVPHRKFEGLFFGVLPNSAISSSQDEEDGQAKLKKSSKNETECTIKPEPIDDDQAPFTPRRSTRHKQDQQKSGSKNTSFDQSRSTAKLFAKARSKAKGRKIVTSTPIGPEKSVKKVHKQIENSVGSEVNIAEQEKKNIQEQSTDENSNNHSSEGSQLLANEADLLGKLLPPGNTGSSQKKIQVESPDASKTEPSDLLGQILGKQVSANKTRKDVTSSWAEDAKSMSKADPDQKYSTSDLGLLEPKQGKNVSYTMWKFGKKRVLIRYTTPGNMHVPHLSKLEKEFQDPSVPQVSDVSLRTKLEYQSNLVFEQMRMGEICSDWVTMMIKRPSKIVRARIDPHQRKILDVEWTMTLNHLNHKAEKIGFNPAVTSKLLTKLFDMIGDLGKGTYICCHRENENKVILRQSTENTSKKIVYDLQKEYCNPGREVFYTSSLPWVRGDPHKGLGLHSQYKLVPMTFDPKNDPDADKHGKLPASTKKSKKRKK